MPLNTYELDAVCDLIADLCGISLDATKEYLIESRLQPLLQSEALESYAQLVSSAKSLTAGVLRQKIIDAITTRETMFFRDRSPFEALKFKALPELIDVKAATAFPRRLRLWSAAASTGQEAYSLAMVLSEMIPDVGSWDIQILGTDISDEAIARASRGWFSELEVSRGLPTAMRSKYFHASHGGWQVNDSLRSLVCFRKMNLLEAFPLMVPVDILFCRNVAIYFEKSKRDDLFRRFKKIMSREAYLFVGASESLLDLGPAFRPHAHCRSTFYRPNLGETHSSVAMC
jgi:chemotaxis protein methyltransferase CheR